MYCVMLMLVWFRNRPYAAQQKGSTEPMPRTFNRVEFGSIKKKLLAVRSLKQRNIKRVSF